MEHEAKALRWAWLNQHAAREGMGSPVVPLQWCSPPQTGGGFPVNIPGHCNEGRHSWKHKPSPAGNWSCSYGSVASSRQHGAGLLDAMSWHLLSVPGVVVSSRAAHVCDAAVALLWPATSC